MNRWVVARLVVAIAAIALFGWGIRTDNDRMRVVAIVALGVAVLLRFASPRKKRTE